MLKYLIEISNLLKSIDSTYSFFNKLNFDFNFCKYDHVFSVEKGNLTFNFSGRGLKSPWSSI